MQRISCAFLLTLIVVVTFTNSSLVYATPVDSCPYSALTGRTIVLFPLNLVDDHLERIVSDTIGYPSYSYKTVNVSTSLAAGTYDVSLFSADAGIDRASLSTPELKEKFFVIVKNGETEVTRTNSTDDLTDGVNNVSASKVVNINLVLSQSANGIVAYHSNYPDASSANSVIPVCAAFDLKTPPVTPSTSPSPTLTPTPTPSVVPPSAPVVPPYIPPGVPPYYPPYVPPYVPPYNPPITPVVPELPLAGFGPGDGQFPLSIVVSALSSLILVSIVLRKAQV